MLDIHGEKAGFKHAGDSNTGLQLIQSEPGIGAVCCSHQRAPAAIPGHPANQSYSIV